ncbi:hypothetical protein K432DRAFT_322181 [Lepidopterella palustris CBS 459.81]|uniref:F-box domain-containing protein n=1 Tax=Lepidopterella palustris CBS 459.81 TaxID=1314670 RepID=A0A8E2EGM3_9PEZI|nr:hypothetical protein K432DRAFT_322181 [Lepidopterella palustris CBS 459.81]
MEPGTGSTIAAPQDRHVDESCPEPGNSRFLSLADELILGIIEQIDESKALCTLARTNSRLQALVEPYIYQSVVVTHAGEAIDLVKSLKSRTDRLLAIQSLKIAYVEEDENGMEALNFVLRDLPNLRYLMVETPCINNGPHRDCEWESQCRIDFVPLFQEVSLPAPRNAMQPFSMLQSVVLHAHADGDDTFTLASNAAIFLHPTLRNISISCADITEDLYSSLKGFEQSTPLSSLTFIECNISAIALKALLELPRALKELTLGERQYHFRPSPTGTLAANNRIFMEALQRQQESLEYIKHVGGDCFLPSLVELEAKLLPAFTNLRTMELGPWSCIRRYLMVGGTPPTLETVRFLNMYAHPFIPRHRLGVIAQMEWNEAVDIAVNKLPGVRQVDIVLAKDYVRVLEAVSMKQGFFPLDHTQPSWAYRKRRDDVYRIANPLRARGAGFRLYHECFPEGRDFIPPYLHGEDTPVEVLVYDSDVPFKFGAAQYSNDEEKKDPDGKIRENEDGEVGERGN